MESTTSLSLIRIVSFVAAISLTLIKLLSSTIADADAPAVADDQSSTIVAGIVAINPAEHENNDK